MPVELTFDDGPHDVWTPQVLAALDRAGVTATFFVVGELAERYSDIVRDELARGHRVQPHCWSHSKTHQQMEPDEIAADIAQTLRVLEALDVPAPTQWRPAGGATKPPYSADIAANHGLELRLWDVDVRDFDLDQTADVMLEQIRTRQPQPGYDQPRPLTQNAVVLMHDGRLNTERTTSENTVGLIEPLSAYVRERGWTFGFV